MLRVLWREVKQAFTVLRHERVEIYQRTNSLWNSISGASDYAATVRVPAENHIREILPSEQVDDIRDMSRKINSGRAEMRAFTHARKSRRKHLVAGVLKAFSYSLPTPATMPRPVHKHVSSLMVLCLRRPDFSRGADSRRISLFIRSRQTNTLFFRTVN